MRFLSKFGQFGLQIRAEDRENYANGTSRLIQTQVFAKFEPGICSSDERELAIRRWRFNGQLQELDEVTSIQPDYRIGLFDSRAAQAENGWSDEERMLVETKLLKLASDTPTDLLVVIEARVEAPWPRYDVFEGTTTDLMNKIVEDGYTLEAVLAYERENQNRPKIIEALEQMIDDGDVVPTVVAEEELVG